MRLKAFFVSLILMSVPSLSAQEDRQPIPPSTQPSEGQGLIQANDQAALTASVGKEVVIEGIVSKAEWSKSGKVMNIEFKDSQLMGAVFERDSKGLNEGFKGDFAKTITNAKVRVKAKLDKYGGKDPKFEDRLQVIIKKAYQVTVMEPADQA